MVSMINKASLDLIKEFEGFRAKAYKDPVGIWTIGYGTTAMAGVGIVPAAGMVITEAQAEGYLMAAVNKFGAEIEPLLKRLATENQFGAMVSLAYNIGPAGFKRSSVLRRFNEGDDRLAGAAFLMWNKAGGRVLAGLVRRREAERVLFMSGASSVPVPTSPQVPAPPAPVARGFWARLMTMIFGGRG